MTFFPILVMRSMWTMFDSSNTNIHPFNTEKLSLTLFKWIFSKQVLLAPPGLLSFINVKKETKLVILFFLLNYVMVTLVPHYLYFWLFFLISISSTLFYININFFLYLYLSISLSISLCLFISFSMSVSMSLYLLLYIIFPLLYFLLLYLS